MNCIIPSVNNRVEQFISSLFYYLADFFCVKPSTSGSHAIIISSLERPLLISVDTNETGK